MFTIQSHTTKVNQPTQTAQFYNQYLQVIHKNLEHNYNCNTWNQDIDQIYFQLNQLITSGEIRHVQFSLKILNKLFKNGYSSGLIRYTSSIQYLVKYFNRKAEELNTGNSVDCQYHMLQVLGLFAHLLHENRDFQFPLTRKFTLNIFSIDADLTQNCARKREILKIISIILCHFSKKLTFLKKIKLLFRFRTVLLQHYRILDPQDISTFLRFHAALRNLSKMIPLKSSELVKHKIAETQQLILLKGGVHLGSKKANRKRISFDPNLKSDKLNSLRSLIS